MNNNNNNFPYLSYLLNLLTIVQQVVSHNNQTVFQSQVRTDKEIMGLEASNLRTRLRDRISNIDNTVGNISTNGRVSTLGLFGIIGAVGILLLRRGNTQNQQVNSRLDSQTNITTDLQNKVKTANAQSAATEQRLKSLTQSHNELQNTQTNAIASQSETNPNQAVHVNSNHGLNSDMSAMQLLTTLTARIDISRNETTNSINSVRETHERFRDATYNRLNKVEQSVQKLKTAIRYTGESVASTSSEVHPVTASLPKPTKKLRGPKAEPIKPNQGDPPEACKDPLYHFLDDDKSDKDGDNTGRDIIPPVAVIETNFIFIETNINPNLVIINKKNSFLKNYLFTNKKVYCIQDTFNINKKFYSIQKPLPIKNSEYQIQNYLKKDNFLNNFESENKIDLIKTNSYNNLDEGSPLHLKKDDVLNTKIIKNPFDKNPFDENPFDENSFDRNSFDENFYENNFNISNTIKTDTIPSDSNSGLDTLFILNKQKNLLVYKQPLYGRVIQKIYPKNNFILAHETDIIFSTLTPVIELIEFCIIDTGNPIYIGLFIPIMGSMYIFEYVMLVIISSTTFCLLSNSILILLNYLSCLVFNKNIKTELTSISTKFWNLLLYVLLFHSLYFKNGWLFLKLSFLVFNKQLLTGHIYFSKHQYTKYIDINIEDDLNPFDFI